MEKTSADYVHATFKGLVSAVPYAGGPLSILFENIFSAPIDRRKTEWLNSLDEAIKELTEKVDGLSPESLRENEIFISVAMQASHIALKNHQQEKLLALKNAVKNSVLQKSMDENKALIFTRVIDELTPLHIQVLSFLDDPLPFEEELQRKAGPNTTVNYPANANIWNETFPSMSLNNPLIDHIVLELQGKNFIHPDAMYAGIRRATTSHGHEFLIFIQ